MLGTTRQARAGRRRAGRSSAFLSSLLSHRARWLLLHLDLDVGSRRANAVSDNGSLGRRTYDFARPNVECGAVPGQVTSPSARGPPRRVQVLSSAKNWLSTLNRAICSPFTST